MESVPHYIRTRHWPARFVALVLVVSSIFPIVVNASKLTREEGGSSMISRGYLLTGKRFITARSKTGSANECIAKISTQIRPAKFTSIRAAGAAYVQLSKTSVPLAFSVRATISEYRMLKIARGNVSLNGVQREFIVNANFAAIFDPERDGGVTVLPVPRPMLFLNDSSENKFVLHMAPSKAMKLHTYFSQESEKFTPKIERAQQAKHCDLATTGTLIHLPNEVAALFHQRGDQS